MGTAQKILNSANPGEMTKDVYVAAKTREDTASTIRKYSGGWSLRGIVCRNIFIRLSKKEIQRIQEEKEERLPKNVDG